MDTDTPFSFLITKAFTLREVAEVLGVCLTQVVGHVEDGTLVAINVGRGSVRRDLRVTDDDLDAFVRDRRVEPAGQAESRPRTPKQQQRTPTPGGYAARRAERIANTSKRRK